MSKVLTLLGQGLKFLFTTAPGALKNHLNVIELFSVIVSAPLGGGAGAVIAFVLAHAALFIPGATDQWLVTILVGVASAIGSMFATAKAKLSQGATAPLSVVGSRRAI